MDPGLRRDDGMQMMNVQDILQGVVLVVVIGLMFYLPQRFSRKKRIIAGGLLCILGWVGLFVGLALDDAPAMQVEFIAYAWVTSCAVAIVLSIVLLVPVAFEWRKDVRSRRRRRERWPVR